MSDSSQPNSNSNSTRRRRIPQQQQQQPSEATTTSASTSSNSTPVVQQQHQTSRSGQRHSQRQHGRQHGLENPPQAPHHQPSSAGAAEPGPSSHGRARGRGGSQHPRSGRYSHSSHSRAVQSPREDNPPLATLPSFRGSHATPSGARGRSRSRGGHQESSGAGRQLKNYLINEKGQYYVPSESERRAAHSRNDPFSASSVSPATMIPYDGPDLFSLLPVEIHCRIFSFLPCSLTAMTATNTRFYSVCQRFIWKRLLSELCDSLEIQMEEDDDGQLRVDLDVLEPTSDFQPASPSVALVDLSNSCTESKALPAPEGKWTNQMTYCFIDNVDYGWRIGDYREDALLPSSRRFSFETEPRVALSKPSGSDPSLALLVSSQGGSLCTAAFDSRSTRNRCRFFASDANWHSVNAHISSITSLRTFNSSASILCDSDVLASGNPASTQFAAIGSITGWVKIFNLYGNQGSSPVPVTSFKVHSRAVESLDAFGDLLWSGGTAGNVVLCRISDGQLLRSIDMDARIWSVRCDSSRVAIGTGGGLDRPTLRIHDLETGTELNAIKGHAGVYDLQFFNSPGSSYGEAESDSAGGGCGTLLSASYDGMVCQWDLRAKNPCVATFCDPGDEPLYCLQRRGWKLAVGTALYSSVRLWDLRKTGGATFGDKRGNGSSGRCLRSFFVRRCEGPIYSLCFDETKLFATPRDSLYMLNFATST